MAHLDTGLIYRATGARVLAGEDPLKAAQFLRQRDLDRDDLRTPDVAQIASKIAAIPEVREALEQFQKDFAARDGGAVLDGRDIGTVICPQADVKLYVTASDKVRAARRYAELSAKGEDVTPEGVLEDLQARDKRDRERLVAPMRPAHDAEVIDTSQMDIEQAVAAAIAHVDAVLGKS